MLEVVLLPPKAVLAFVCLTSLIIYSHSHSVRAIDDIPVTGSCLICALTESTDSCDRCLNSETPELSRYNKRTSGGDVFIRPRSTRTTMCACCIWTRHADRDCCNMCSMYKGRYNY